MKITFNTDELLESKNPEELRGEKDVLKALLQLVELLATKYKNKPAQYVGQLRDAERRELEDIIKDLDTK